MAWEIEQPKKVVIIGGNAAGCKTAARLSRLLPECDIKVVERGEIVSFGNCGMPFYAAGEVDDLLDLAKTPWGTVRTPEFFGNSKGVTVLTRTEATSIDPDGHQVVCRQLINGNEVRLDYDALVLATGSKPVSPPIELPKSERIRTFLKPDDARIFRQLAQTGQVGSVLIVGGGFIGVELAEAMVSLWGMETTLIEKEDQVLPGLVGKPIARLVQQVLKRNNVHVKLGIVLQNLEVLEDGISAILSDGSRLTVDFVFTCFGIQPETELAKQVGAELAKNGGILVDEQMKTSVPGIWAAGDCVAVSNLVSGVVDWFPFGSLANRQGRVAADSIAGRPGRFPGAVGTASLKVFNFIVASTGLTAAKASKQNLIARQIWGTFLDRPDYHPEKKNLFAELVYEPDTLRVLGMQMAGMGEVTRYVDTISALLSNHPTAFDLLELEHAYTPPHSSPISPLNHLGAMVLAQERDGVSCVPPDLAKVENSQLLDVRSPEEWENAPLERSTTHIPYEEIRSRYEELDPRKPYHVICRRGPRSYEVARYLQARGFGNVDYVGGGTALLAGEEDEKED